MRRLPPVTGELIDRGQAVAFVFEGKPLRGYRGDTISSALSASGVRVLGRSFKYHRPRGLLSAAGHDANSLRTPMPHSYPVGGSDSRPIAARVRPEGGRSAAGVRPDCGTGGAPLCWSIGLAASGGLPGH